MDAHDLEAQQQHIFHKQLDYSDSRRGFVRKVYGIIAVQLLITIAFIFIAQTPLYTFFDSSNPTAQAFITFALTGSLMIMIIIACYTSISRLVPINYLLLGLFTLSEAYIVAYFTAGYDLYDIIVATLLMFSLTLILSIYAMVTSTDFTTLGGILCIICWSLLALTALFLLMVFGGSEAWRTSDILLSVFGIGLYGLYLVYDTQMIMGGKRYSLSIDDYILASVMLYLDVIILFIRILDTLGQLAWHH